MLYRKSFNIKFVEIITNWLKLIRGEDRVFLRMVQNFLVELVKPTSMVKPWRSMVKPGIGHTHSTLHTYVEWYLVNNNVLHQEYVYLGLYLVLKALVLLE